MASVAQAEHLLDFFEATEEEKDYSVIGSFSPAEAVGKCVYCNHCKPRCPFHVKQENRMREIAAYFQQGRLS